ncbi:MAG: Na+/H+ antiporter subunit B [Planctomycetota bacterium]
MNSVILRTATKLLLPLLIVFSMVLLMRGHNLPGGGFVAGLVTASAFALHAIAFGPDATRKLLRLDVLTYIAGGLAIGLASGVFALLVGDPFMQGQWVSLDLSGIGEEELKLGTPLIFDVGVYLTVVGVTLMMIFSLAETA